MPFIRYVQKHPSAGLLLIQFVGLLLYPWMETAPRGRALFGAFGLVVLGVALYVVRRTPSLNWIATLLALPVVALALIQLLWPDARLMVLTAALEAAFYFYATGSLITYMLDDDTATTDELWAAGATFTLLAWAFAYAFYVCQAWFPGSFTAAVDPEQPRTWMELLFLSFTNLSATGLGDVLPMSAPARVLVMFEQFAGVAYIATVVSRLIGLTIVTERRTKDERAPRS